MGAGIYETPTPANGIYARPELNIYYYGVSPKGGIPARPQNKNRLLGFYGGWGLARPPWPLLPYATLISQTLKVQQIPGAGFINSMNFHNGDALLSGVDLGGCNHVTVFCAPNSTHAKAKACSITCQCRKRSSMSRHVDSLFLYKALVASWRGLLRTPPGGGGPT